MLSVSLQIPNQASGQCRFSTIDAGWWPWSANHSSVLENTTTNRKPQTGKVSANKHVMRKTELQTGKQNHRQENSTTNRKTKTGKKDHKQENRTTNRKTEPQTGKHKQDNISANKHNRTRNRKRSHKQENRATNRKTEPQTGKQSYKKENTTANQKIVVLWIAVVFSSV